LWPEYERVEKTLAEGAQPNNGTLVLKGRRVIQILSKGKSQVRGAKPNFRVMILGA